MYSLRDYIRASPVHFTGEHSIYELHTITCIYEVSLKRHVEFNHYFANIAKVAKLYFWLRQQFYKHVLNTFWRVPRQKKPCEDCEDCEDFSVIRTALILPNS